MKDLLVVNDLTKSYQDGGVERRVLDAVSLNVSAGELHCFLGPSGSGKTTLLNCLSGLDRFDGFISLFGKDVSKISVAESDELRSRKIGFVYQSHHLLLDLNVIDNIALPAVLAGASVALAKDLALRLVQDFDLVNVKESVTHLLSGGERQRVAVARALINKPGLLIADEPTGNLDKDNAQLIIDRLYDYVADGSSACIVATHDLNLIRSGCIRHNFIKCLLTTEVVL